jgi:hypothetical protein
MQHLSDSSPWELYFESMKKQKYIRKLLINLLVFTRDQRDLTGSVLNKYIRAWSDRHRFSVLDLSHLPDDIPFEMFCFWRHFYLEEFDGMNYQEYLQEH